MIKTLEWCDGSLRLVDQTRLPGEEVYLELRDYRAVGDAIKRLVVRGAPAIGVAAAYGLVLAALEAREFPYDGFYNHLRQASGELRSTRPTAVNLAWALDRLLARLESLEDASPAAATAVLLAEADSIASEDAECNRLIGSYGASLLPDPVRVLTHCNAGALATNGIGTALGVIRSARDAGKQVQVLADETRPLLQGARLTAWELMKDDIKVTLITDSMAAYVMSRGMVDVVLVGADRITACGDVANKIGTYSLAVNARFHGIPFYVAAPTSTLDLSMECGTEIPIEERSGDEVRTAMGYPLAPPGVPVFNPAFDVTPADLVTAIITEKGVFYPPYRESLAILKGEQP